MNNEHLEKMNLDIKKAINDAEKQKSCPVCGAMRDRERFMRRYEDELSMFLRRNNEVKRDSCIYCVEKHVGKAMVLLDELLSNRPLHAEHGTAEYDARIKTELNHLGVIGNLQAATDEAEEWQELHDTLLSAEREYRYHGTVPDWENISGLIKNVKENYSGTTH